MSLPCGCAPRWLTSVSEPVSAEAAVAARCGCCGAGIGCRCIGGGAGWLPGARSPEERRAWVDVCPSRLELQAAQTVLL